MQRFRPTSSPNTLSDKVNGEIQSARFRRATSSARIELRIAQNLGMDQETRASLARLTAHAGTQRVAIIGKFMPDRGVSAQLVAKGLTEEVNEADFFRYQRVLIPYGGISPKQRRKWQEAGQPLEDFTASQVKRAQVALGLLRIEGAQALVIGRHEDPETRAIAGDNCGTRIIQDTTDTARLEFSPTFGVVCQTHLSPRRVKWLVQQLRLRYRDAKVTFLETLSPAMAAREEALERLLVDCNQAVIVGEPGESSCEALAETALRHGKSAVIIPDVSALATANLSERKIALSAGAFATDEAIRSIAEALLA